MIKVLVVDDSQVARDLIVYMLGSDPDIRVIGTARDGREAIEEINRKKPDLITMDINMPNMNGLDATRKIMETNPTPIVIVSGSSVGMEVEHSFAAMEAGALAVVQKPRGAGHPDHETTAKELIQTVKLMSEVKVVRRWPRKKTEAEQKDSQAAATPLKRVQTEIKVIAIGASTGGPPVLHKILSGLPKDFASPLLIVQHMATGFVQGMADWISQSSGFPVHVAADGEHIMPGHAYVAPDEYHMGVKSDGHILLSRDEPENGLRPSVSYLFRSVANACGRNVIGVLLTGMGKDGAEELKILRRKGAVTIAQDEESSIIYGMPGEAVKLDAATFVLPADKISAALTSLVNNRQETVNNISNDD